MAAAGGFLVSLDPHYMVLVTGLVIYKFQNLKDIAKALGMVLTFVAIMVIYTYWSFGYEGIKSVYINLLFISDGVESMSMIWYFYIV